MQSILGLSVLLPSSRGKDFNVSAWQTLELTTMMLIDGGVNFGFHRVRASMSGCVNCLPRQTLEYSKCTRTPRCSTSTHLPNDKMQKPLIIILLPVLAAKHAHASLAPKDAVLLEGRQISLDITNATQSQYNTTIGMVNGLNFGVDNEEVIAQDMSIAPPEHSAAFTILWEYLEEELCGASGCIWNREYCALAAAGGPQVCINAHGNYSSDARAEFIGIARALFDRNVRYIEPDSGSGVTEEGPAWVAVQGEPQNGNLPGVNVSLRNRRKGEETSGLDQEYVYAGEACSFIGPVGLCWTVLLLSCWL